VPRYPLIGGPCDGTRSQNYAREPRDGTIIRCKGAGYQYNYGNRGVFVWLDVGPLPGAGGTLDTKQVGKAWHRLMHVFGVEAPQAIRASRAARARLRRLSR